MPTQDVPVRGFLPLHEHKPISWPEVKRLVDEGIEDLEATGVKVTTVMKIQVGQRNGRGWSQYGLLYEGFGRKEEALAESPSVAAS